MSKISITKLHSAGSEFFTDPENFLDDLTGDANLLKNIEGGGTPTAALVGAGVGAIAGFYYELWRHYQRNQLKHIPVNME